MNFLLEEEIKSMEAEWIMTDGSLTKLDAYLMLGLSLGLIIIYYFLLLYKKCINRKPSKMQLLSKLKGAN